MIIIGEQKKTKELPLFAKEEILQMVRQVAVMKENSMPLEVPVALRTLDLFRIAKTLQTYRDLLEKFESACGNDSPGLQEDHLDFDEVMALRKETTKALNPKIPNITL